MSINVALDNICLRSSDRWAHTEYSLQYHLDYMARRTGLSKEDPELLRRCFDLFEIDFNWDINDGIIDWKTTGRITDMGHASYAADGGDQHASAESPFQTMEEVWGFDAVEEYGLPDFGEQVRNFGKTHCLVGSFVDCRDLTFGKWEKVQSGLDETFKQLENCKGAILAVGNHLPPNIPEPMMDRYFDYLLPKLKK